MAILDIDSIDIETVDTSNVKTDYLFRSNTELKTSTLFNKDNELSTITHYVAGEKWTVDFFTQIRGVNEEAILPDINVPVSRLKYNRINKLILHLQTPIEQSDPNDIGGEAIINAGFPPNYGDVFIATLTGGREAIFIIDELEKRTYNNHEAYSAKFKLHAFLDKDGVFYRDMIYKTSKVYYYDKDHLLDYSAPIILAEDYKNKIDLKRYPSILANHYFKHMISKEKNVIAVPTLTSIYVDTLLNDFIYKIINRDEVPAMQNITDINVDLSNTISYTVWDAILNRDLDMLAMSERAIGFKFTPSATIDIGSRHISYLGISFMVDALAGVAPATLEYRDIKINTEQIITVPLADNVDNYIFSSAFYEQDIEQCGLLESLLLQYLRGEKVDGGKLQVLLEEYIHWDTIDQYYLIPILILLVKDTVQFTYSSL